MPAVDDDEIKIQHALPGRPQSPALERTARLAVEAAFDELISRKLLYQKVTIDLSGLSQAIGSPELTTPDQLSLLETEVAARPLELEEGDLYAGFYHLRTVVEHFAKLKLGLPLETRERGEDLLAKYGKTIPASLASTLPSLAASYDVLSKHMHARSGTPEEFATQVDAICDHIEGAALLAKYASA